MQKEEKNSEEMFAMLEKATEVYFQKNPEKRKYIEDGIINGEHIRIGRELSLNDSSNEERESIRLFQGIEWVYFFKRCVKHNDGIPVIEVIRDWLDSGNDNKKLNADDSAESYIHVAINNGVKIEVFKKYIHREKRREKLVGKVSPSIKDLEKIIKYIELYDMPDVVRMEEDLDANRTGKENSSKNQVSSMDWAVILFYKMKQYKKEGEFEKDAIARFHEENLPDSGLPAFNTNYNKFKGWIKSADKQAINYLKKNIQFFDEKSSERKNADSDLVILNESLDEYE